MTMFPLLSGFTVDGARMLLEAGEVKHFETGAVVWKEGEAATSTSLILTGKLQVFVEREGTRLALRESGPGAILGEIGVTCNLPRTASVRASEPSEVLQWSAQNFRSLLLRSGLLAERVHQYSVRSLIDKEHNLIDTVTHAQGANQETRNERSGQ
jgi:CRP-like cAMP-binding protein